MQDTVEKEHKRKCQRQSKLRGVNEGNTRLAPISRRKLLTISAQYFREIVIASESHFVVSPRIFCRIRSTSFNPVPVARNTRTEARMAASLYFSFEETISSNLDGVGRWFRTKDGDRLISCSCRSLYSFALNVTRSALRTMGLTVGLEAEEADSSAGDMIRDKALDDSRHGESNGMIVHCSILKMSPTVRPLLAMTDEELAVLRGTLRPRHEVLGAQVCSS